MAPRPVDDLIGRLDSQLRAVDDRLSRTYPGDSAGRQPVHTVYVPASRFDAGTVTAWRDEAIAALDEHLPDAASLAAVIGQPEEVAGEIRGTVSEKLQREPIEDLRIDFEDGYGTPGDEREDADVAAAAQALRDSSVVPPFGGIRFKGFERATRARGVRTLASFVAAVAESGRLLDGFGVTLPKVTAVEQVDAMVTVAEWLEAEHGLSPGSFRFEIQVEAPQSIVAPNGAVAVAQLITAGQGRVSGLHYGTYDYSAAVGIAGAYQSMEHPAADFAKAFMQAAAAGTGVRLSDGSTNIVPAGSPEQMRDAWTLHARLVRRSLERGFYQGWDLHPAQLVTRYAATFAFYREGFAAAAARIRAAVERAESSFMDEPATLQALARFVTRGLECGALSDDEVAQAASVDRAQLGAWAARRIGVA